MINDTNIKLPAHDKLLDDIDVENLVEIVRQVGEFFNWNEKTAIWLNTPNPHFGALIPMSLIIMGRGRKVLQFIKNAREGNLE